MSIVFCKSEAVYDYDTIREEAKLASDSAGCTEANKIDPDSFKRIRGDSVYKTYARGVDTFILFPKAAIWTQAYFGTFLTTLADTISDVVDTWFGAKRKHTCQEQKGGEDAIHARATGK